MRPRRIDRTGWLTIIGIAAVSAALPAILLAPPGDGRTTPSAAVEARLASAVPEAAASPRRAELDRKSGDRVGLADDPKTSLQPYEIKTPYGVDDGLTFGPDGAVRTRLARLEGPARDAICLNGDGHPWACGLQARVALNNALKAGRIVCTPLGPADKTVAATCTVDASDLARQLVAAGFARPTGRDHETEAATARAERRGLWNGGWRLK